jgi:hypothetical protein
MIVFKIKKLKFLKLQDGWNIKLKLQEKKF